MAEIKSLILRITERCNLRCAYCYAADSGCTSADMTPELALRAVELCCPEGRSLRIQFTGGEPLLNIQVIESVHAYGKATGRHLRLAVQTNGTLLSQENCRRLAAMQCAVGVSLDGLAEANRLRCFPDGTASFSAAVQGIRNLGQMGMRCNLTTVVTRVNARALGQLPDIALWLGNVSGVGLDLFRPLGRGKTHSLAPSEADLTQGLQALIQKAKEIQSAGISFRLRELERLKQRAACGGCGNLYCYAQTEQSLCVDAGGNCWPCSSLAGNPGFCLGNLRDGLPQQPRTQSGLEPTTRCTGCPAFPTCGGGCPAGRTVNAGQPDPLTCLTHSVLSAELGGIQER